MVSNLKYYNGCTVLGYRLALPRLESNINANSIRRISHIGSKTTNYSKNNMLNNIKKLRRINYKVR